MALLSWRYPGSYRAWKPLNLSNPNFKRIALDHKIEEELFPDYVASRYYPVRIGEILRGRYQIVGKLGFGASSTVWLARDLDGRRHVALKLLVHSKSLDRQLDRELAMYKRISASSTTHRGRGAVRELLDSFDVTGPDASHRCLVHPPLWESALTFLRRNPVGRLPVPVLAFILHRLFLALDFLHTECQVIHTDIKADNIMFGIEDDTVFRVFEEQEEIEPTPRKEMNGRAIYLSRELQMPKSWGAPVLCDLGSAVTGDIEHTEDIQPDIYRAPEVILEAPWSYPVDIWNTGCMIWDLFEGQHLFTGHDPEFQTYRSRAHLAEMIALLGPPPQTLLESGKLSHRLFTATGDFRKDISLPESMSLEEIEISLKGDSKVKFLAMMRKMLQWDPSKRSTAKDLSQLIPSSSFLSSRFPTGYRNVLVSAYLAPSTPAWLFRHLQHLIVFREGSTYTYAPHFIKALARAEFVDHPEIKGLKTRPPVIFKDLGLLVKYGKAPRVTVAEGQCLWAVGHFAPQVPVPEIYGWAQEEDLTFLYMELIDGVTLDDHWDTLTSTEKSGIFEQLKMIVTEIHCLCQSPDDQFIGNINREPLGDIVFTGTTLPCAGPFSSVAGFHDWLSNMVKTLAKVHRPDLDLADIPDPYREMLADDSPITFTHANLNPVNVMVSKESPCRIIAILDWEQSGWYPAYWEFCKAEYSTKIHSEWQAEYLPKV